MFVFYPETKGKSLEEMDGLFGNEIVDTEQGSRGSEIQEEKPGANEQVKELGVEGH